MTEIKLGRRYFLLNSAAAALVLPILNTFEPQGRIVKAAGMKRAIFFSSFDGIYHGAFWPGVRQDQAGWELGQLTNGFMGGQKTKSLSGLTLPAIISPFESVRSKLMLVHGLQNPNLHAEDDHMAGTKGVFTGGGYQKGEQVPHGSIDWHLKDKLGISHMGLGVQFNGGSYTRIPFYDASGKRQNMRDNPQSVYENLFPNGVPTQSVGTTPTQTTTPQVRKDFLDIAEANLKDLMPRFSGESKLRLDANMQAISDLRKKLTAMNSGGGGQMQPPPANQCSVSSKTYNGSKWPGYIKENGRSSFDATSADFMAEMVIAAFKCNLRQVMNFSFCASTSEIVYSNLGIDKSHHTISHKGKNAGDVAANWEQNYIKISQYHASIIAKIASALDQTIESDGTMLDNTIIHWDNENSFGDPHHHFPQPSLVVGGKNLGLKQGIMASYYRDNQDVQSWVASSDYNKAKTLREGHPDKARLLNSICRAFGTDKIKPNESDLPDIHS
jgi:Protein of unknown function (DUF1552)